MRQLHFSSLYYDDGEILISLSLVKPAFVPNLHQTVT